MSPTSEQLLSTIYYVVIVGNFEVMISHTLSFIYWVIVTKFSQNWRLSQQWSPVWRLPAAFDGNYQHFSQVHCKFSGHIDCKVTRPKAYFNDMRLSTRVWSNWPWIPSKIQGEQGHTIMLAYLVENSWLSLLYTKWYIVSPVFSSTILGDLLDMYVPARSCLRVSQILQLKSS